MQIFYEKKFAFIKFFYKIPKLKKWDISSVGRAAPF